MQLEISKLQSLLQDKSDEFEGEKSILTVNLNKEKQEKINAENEVVMLKSTLKVTNDKIAQLNIEFQDTKIQLDEINDSKKNALLNLNDTEKRLEESKLQNERLDQIKTNLNETIKDLDDEKAALETDLKNSKSRSRQIEDNLHNANQDIETLRNKCHLIETDNQELEDQVNYWQSQHQDLLNDHRELGMISHKKSVITNFGHKHKIKNFIKKIDIFHEKISTAFGFWFIFGIKY